MEIPKTGNIVLKFSADWCGPCRALKPKFDELKSENEGIDFLDADVDEEGELASQYGVRSIPAVFFIKDGEVKTQMLGNKDKQDYQEHINLLLE